MTAQIGQCKTCRFYRPRDSMCLWAQSQKNVPYWMGDNKFCVWVHIDGPGYECPVWSPATDRKTI